MKAETIDIRLARQHLTRSCACFGASMAHFAGVKARIECAIALELACRELEASILPLLDRELQARATSSEPDARRQPLHDPSRIG